jgi:hypothetical protein
MISVIIPSYDCSIYLPAAIQSALGQTYSNVEVVVVNDGSTDDTDEVVKPFLNSIVYIRQDNKGLSVARNVGFRASKGEFVCFLDADDILLPDKLIKQMLVFEREPDLGVVISGYFDVAEDGEAILGAVYKPWHRDALSHLFNHEVFPPHAPLIRRSALERSSLFPEDIVTAESQEDWQLWLDMALNDVAFSSVPEPLCKYRRRPGSISSNPLRHLDGAHRVVSWLREHPKTVQYQEQVDNLANIVEMERVARSLQVNNIDMARETLIAAIGVAPQFWIRSDSYLRLFKLSLSIQEQFRWTAQPSLDLYVERIIERVLPLAQGNIPKEALYKIYAAAYLQLSDLAYAQNNSSVRKQAVKKAIQHSLSICWRNENRQGFFRGLLGPALGSRMGSLIRKLQKQA